MHWIDPQYLPEICAPIERFLFNPRGAIDGLILAEVGLEVHVPPHLDAQVRRHLRIGDRVGVRGVRPRSATMISAIALVGSDGVAILDEGAHGDDDACRPELVWMTARARFTRFLHGPQGEIRGALLADGTLLRWPPHESARLFDLLRGGADIIADGDGWRSEHGAVIDVTAIGASEGTMRPLDRKRRQPPHDGAEVPAHG